MSIVCSAVTEYLPLDAPYRTTLYRDPVWAQIEAAIDRLDRNRFPPMLDLHAAEPAHWTNQSTRCTCSVAVASTIWLTMVYLVRLRANGRLLSE